MDAVQPPRGDAHDELATHLTAVDRCGRIVGSVRVIPRSALGFPFWDRCRMFAGYRHLRDPSTACVELSRWTIRNRQGDRRACFALFRAIHRLAKRQGITHLLAALDAALWATLARHGLVFTRVGPDVDGIAPYLGIVADLAAACRTRDPELFAWCTAEAPSVAEDHPLVLHVGGDVVLAVEDRPPRLVGELPGLIGEVRR